MAGSIAEIKSMGQMDQSYLEVLTTKHNHQCTHSKRLESNVTEFALYTSIFHPKQNNQHYYLGFRQKYW